MLKTLVSLFISGLPSHPCNITYTIHYYTDSINDTQILQQLSSYNYIMIIET